jgi:oligoribonuclease NrnB/cAMP/cGMP phosphodiesterase (DHH superfamily)
VIQFYHISHTDLDGYGCQFITKKFFKNGKFFNANYGIEVQSSLNIVIDSIKQSEQKDIFFLISDLNLTYDESKKLDKNIKQLNNNGYNINLQLLDHHGSGQKSADRFSWYYLDTSRSATKITYDYFLENYQTFNISDEIIQQLTKYEKLINSINAVDIWLEHSQYFEFGKVCMSMIAKSYEINNTLFADQNRDYRLDLLSKTINYIDQNNGYIKLDEDIYFLKKEYLKLSNKDDSLDNLSAKYLVKLLDDTKDKLTIYYNGHKGLLTYTLGNISIPANSFLKANPDYDFFIDVSRRGKMGLRANGKLDVSILANKMANGGGHPNASGAAFEDWKETVNYNDIKQFIENRLKEIS